MSAAAPPPPASASAAAPASAVPSSALTAPSPFGLDQLSAHLQQLPKQTGTLIMDHAGHIAASTGDLKESGDRVSRLLLTMLQDVNGIFVHSLPTAGTQAGDRDELVKITVAFKTYQYAVSLTHDLILCVKTNLD